MMMYNVMLSLAATWVFLVFLNIQNQSVVGNVIQLNKKYAFYGTLSFPPFL